VLTRLPDDAATVAFLARSGRTLDSVPAAGEPVFLRATANLSTGGTSTDRTDEMHPDNVTACEMAAGAVGLDVAGIDVLSPDISVPFRENGAVIIEVNASPGIRMHTHPAEGRPRNVGAPIIDLLYPPGTETEIPVLAVTGTNGKTTTTRLLAHLFRHTGRRRLHDHRRRLPEQPAGDGGRHDGAVRGQRHPLQPDGRRRGARDGARRTAARGTRLRRVRRGHRAQRGRRPPRPARHPHAGAAGRGEERDPGGGQARGATRCSTPTTRWSRRCASAPAPTWC
jgi:hypothetical protein